MNAIDECVAWHGGDVAGLVYRAATAAASLDGCFVWDVRGVLIADFLKIRGLLGQDERAVVVQYAGGDLEWLLGRFLSMMDEGFRWVVWNRVGKHSEWRSHPFDRVVKKLSVARSWSLGAN